MNCRCLVFGHGIIGEQGVRRLLSMGVDVVGIFGHKAGADDWQPSLSRIAESLGVEYFLDADLSASQTLKIVRSMRADVAVSLYYRDLIPDGLLTLTRRGGINLHGSPLPLYRGRAPVNWMVLRGETVGGVTLHIMTRRPDAGPIIAQRKFPIGERDTAYDVLLQVKKHGLELLEEYLPAFIAGTVTATPQGKGSYFGRRCPEDGLIDWNRPASEIYNLVRALTRPYPGAFTYYKGRKLMVWWAEKEPEIQLAPGRIVPDGHVLLAGTATHALRLVDVEEGR